MVENFKYNDYYEIAIENNMGLVFFVINKYYKSYSEYHYEDLVQIGRIALYKAIETYDKNMAEFSTYATRVIRNSMHEYLISKKKKHRGVIDGYFYSLDKQVDGDCEGSLINKLEYEEDFSFIITSEILECIKSTKDIQIITVSKMIILGYTYEDIGKKLGVSRQRVHQIVIKIRRLISGKFPDNSYVMIYNALERGGGK